MNIRCLLLLSLLAVPLSARGGSVQGFLFYSGTATGTLIVSAVTNVTDINYDEAYEDDFDVAGPFTNAYLLTNMPAGSYFIISALETNDNTDEWCPWGHYETWSSNAVAVAVGTGTAAGISFSLVDGSVSNNPYVGGDEPDASVVCDGEPASCLTPAPGWEYEGMSVNEPYYFDTWVVRLSNGNYRLYGNSPDQVLYGTNAFESYLSTNGTDFVHEAGYRLEEPGCFMPCVIPLTNGDYRCYYTDQSYAPNCESGECGGRAIRSALSTNGGMNFAVEGDRLVCNTNLAYEFKGVRGARILPLTNGQFRMYYHAIDSNGYWRMLSAISADGLSWSREDGVRMDPAEYCPSASSVRNFSPCIPFSDGIVYMYVAMSVCGEDWENARAGIFECVSADGGLTFTPAEKPILENYYIAETYTGDPADPQVMAQDPTAIMTTNGLRMYFGLYDGPYVITNISGIYSTLKWDFDLDGAADWREYVAGTDPNDSNSCFVLEPAEYASGATQEMILSWSAASGRYYRIERSTNLLTGFDFAVATNLPALPALNIYTDNTTSGEGPYYYRIGIE
ncbi:MAG: hypothetical protein AB7T27_11895 [Kiritimatiellia bacterium]